MAFASYPIALPLHLFHSASRSGSMKRMVLIGFLIVLAAPLAGCGITPTPGHGPPPFANAVFVSGHYSRNGHWIAGHWI